MGYMHIDNLYKNQEILMFKECYALEKIHGTSAHISYILRDGKPHLHFFSGGAKHANFVQIFDQDALLSKLKGIAKVIVYGEAYGGKLQGMSASYGKDLKFVAFDVKIDDCWLAVPQAAEFVESLGLEFVDYVRVTTDINVLNNERDKPSTQAIRNNCGNDKKREGVVLRPLIEVTKNNGKRIMSKHKGDDFRETKTKREVSPSRLKVLTEAAEIAAEWVTPMRIVHVLDKIENPEVKKIPEIIRAMIEDIKREGEGEIQWSKEVSKAIANATSQGVIKHLKQKIQC